MRHGLPYRAERCSMERRGPEGKNCNARRALIHSECVYEWSFGRSFGPSFGPRPPGMTGRMTTLFMKRGHSARHSPSVGPPPFHLSLPFCLVI